MNLNINLATRVYINFKLVNLVLALSLLLCCSWLAFNLYSFTANLEQMKRYTALASHNSGATAVKAVPAAEYNKFLAQVKTYNAILYKRSYDWLTLLENLEQLVPAGVSLKLLEPSKKGESVRLTGTATGFPAVRKFIENIEGSKVFTEVYLTDQTFEKLENKRKAVNFSVTCKVATP